jgi:DNA-binding Lrp family transcriptional regulator
MKQPPRSGSPVVKAYVLVVTDPGRTHSVALELKDTSAVTEVHEVMGPYDIVAEVEVEQLTDVPSVIIEQIRAIEGIQSTTSLVAFPV